MSSAQPPIDYHRALQLVLLHQYEAAKPEIQHRYSEPQSHLSEDRGRVISLLAVAHAVDHLRISVEQLALARELADDSPQSQHSGATAHSAIPSFPKASSTKPYLTVADVMSAISSLSREATSLLQTLTLLTDDNTLILRGRGSLTAEQIEADQCE